MSKDKVTIQPIVGKNVVLEPKLHTNVPVGNFFFHETDLSGVVLSISKVHIWATPDMMHLFQAKQRSYIHYLLTCSIYSLWAI